jgi:hypothetical protein
MSSVNAVKKEAVIFRMVTAQKMCVHGPWAPLSKTIS